MVQATVAIALDQCPVGNSISKEFKSLALISCVSINGWRSHDDWLTRLHLHGSSRASSGRLLGPTIVEVLGNALLAAQLGNAVRAAPALKDDPDRRLGRDVVRPGRPAAFTCRGSSMVLRLAV